jgi:hypothetical protein
MPPYIRNKKAHPIIISGVSRLKNKLQDFTLELTIKSKQNKCAVKHL